MREAFFILIVLFLLAGLTAYRYRRQIRFAVQLWRTVKSVREKNFKETPEINETAKGGTLVNCSRCGSWKPEASAIKFGPTIYYCSTKCLQSKSKV